MVAVAAEIGAQPLNALLQLMAAEGINLYAYAADDSGMRFFTGDPEATKKAITEAGHFCQIVDVLMVTLGNEPGALRGLIHQLNEAGIQILSTFGMGIGDRGRIFVRVDDLEGALAAARL